MRSVQLEEANRCACGDRVLLFRKLNGVEVCEGSHDDGAVIHTIRSCRPIAEVVRCSR